MTDSYTRSRQVRGRGGRFTGERKERQRPGPKRQKRRLLSRVATDANNEVKVDLHIADASKAKPEFAGKLVMHLGIWRRREYDQVTRGGRTVKVPVEGGECDVPTQYGITLEFVKQVPAAVPEIVRGLVEVLRLADPSKLVTVKAVVDAAIAKGEGE